MILTRRAVMMGGGAAVLSACSPPALLTQPDLQPSQMQKVLAITNRAVAADRLQGFDQTRSDQLFYMGYDISVPPLRKAGEYSFPRKRLDPEAEFFVADTQRIDTDTAMLEQINARLATIPKGQRSVSLFIHGYNVSYPGAVFRAAQIATDFNLTHPLVLFSWPSMGKLTGYAYDRDSVLYAREGLVQALRLLAQSKAEKVTLLAHSMGTLLSMEAIRQLALEKDRHTLSRINGVILVQPDIDVDVFRSQMRDLKQTGPQIAVVASRRDKALKLSAVLTGGHPRVGDAQNIEELRNQGVIVLDVTQIPAENPVAHRTFMQSPLLISMIASGQLSEQIIAGAPGQDILIGGLTLTGNAALAVAYLPYTVFGS